MPLQAQRVIAAPETPPPQDKATWRNRLRRFMMFGILAMSGIILAILVISPTRENMAMQVGRHLAETSEILLEMLPETMPPSSEEAEITALLNDLPLPIATRAWLIRPNGEMFSNRFEYVAAINAENAAPRIFAALGDKSYSRYNRRDGTEVILGRAAMQNGDWLLLAKSEHDVPGIVNDQQIRLLRLGFFGSLLVMLVSYFHLSNISGSVNNLMVALRESQSSGQVAQIPDLGQEDQIGKLSQTLRETMAALHERIETNAQFAADVAHELKNPLASLQSASQTLGRVSDPEKQARLISIIQQDVRRMDRLLSEISNASRLDSDLVASMAERFDLRDVILPLVDYYAEEAAAAQVKLEHALPDQPVEMNGLPERLGQVLVNLITNALSFSPPGSEMRVLLYRVEGRALVVIEDGGPGIPEGALEKIFTRFYSERPGLSFGEHSGLGLAIAKQIVEAHDGVIWAENIAPNGARFVVGLPL